MNYGDAFFSFRFRSPNSENHIEETLVVFPGLAAFTNQGLAQAIESALEKNLLPDKVVILCGLTDFSRLLNAANDNPDLNAAINRGRTIKSVLLAAYDKAGEIKRQNFLRGKSIEKPSSTQIAQFGVKALFEKNIDAVLVRAKHGFLFAKPSSRRSNYFIRAEGLALELADTSFLAFYLLRFLNDWIIANRRNPEAIYIDSMSIATVAMALIEMRRRLDRGFGYPRVISFHSYEGLSTMASPPRNSSICIISASTSSNLATAWRNQFGSTGEEVITLLSLVNSEINNKVAYTIPKPLDYVSKSNSDDHSGVRLIRVSGEHFWVEAFPCRSVLLTRKNHCPEKLPKDMEVFVASGAIDCRRRPTPTADVRALHVSGSNLFSQRDFLSWANLVVEQQIPTSVMTIIYQDDDDSKKLAQLVLELLRKNSGVRRRIRLQSDRELASTREKWKGTAVVIAAVIGKGSRLLSVSRDLRDSQQSGARIYLVGVAVAPTAKVIDDLRKNLTYSSCQDRYEVHIFRPLAVGNEGILDSWTTEANFLSTTLLNTRNDYLENRQSTLQRTGDGLKEKAFFSSSCTNLPLTLRDEFAFWDFEYIGGSSLLLQADVYLTICRILQHSRESDRIAHDARLSSEVFQHVVLSPDCFSRFNDGVIQAALLRGCFRSELDYRGDAALSDEMAAICLRIIQSHNLERGEASVEFLMALACGRLRIEPRSLNNILVVLGKDSGYANYPSHFQILLSKIESQNIAQ